MQPDGVASFNEGVDYKKKYKTLKRKLRMLIYEQECFAEELRKAQRKLLRISRDKSFLLDRLLQYEQCEQSATDTDSTADTESDNEQPPNKRKKPISSIAVVTETPSPSLLASMMTQRIPPSKSYTATLPSQSASQSPADITATKSRGKVSKKMVKQGPKLTSLPQFPSNSSTVTSNPPNILAVTSPTRLLARSLQGQGQVKLGGQAAMSREELERHLEQKQSNKSAFMNIEKTPLLPDNIFNENSNS